MITQSPDGLCETPSRGGFRKKWAALQLTVGLVSRVIAQNNGFVDREDDDKSQFRAS